MNCGVQHQSQMCYALPLPFFMLQYIKVALLPASALNITSEHKSSPVASTNMNIIVG